MNKNEIIEYLKNYDLDKNKYIIISSAAMVLLGIKEKTKDIDIAVTKDYYNYLLNNYNCEFETNDNNGVYFIDKINFGMMYYSDNKNYINDIPIQSIEQIKNLKIYLNREKDKIDLELIDKFIGENNE